MDEVPAAEEAPESVRLDHAPTQATPAPKHKLAAPLVWLIDIVIGAAIALIVVFAVAKFRDDSEAAPTVGTPSSSATSATATGRDGPAMVLDLTKQYGAVITTNYGKIVVALDVTSAPKGTNNFVVLARKGFFNGTTIHRTVADFVIQGGSPDGSGDGGPGYVMQAEVPSTPYKAGDIAYAKTLNDPPGSASSQWFIVTGSTAALDQTIANGAYDYARFGRVVEGMDIAKKIERLAPPTAEGGAPTKPVTVVSVTITET